jgi:phosphoadenosine phosphosulfate reductase
MNDAPISPFAPSAEEYHQLEISHPREVLAWAALKVEKLTVATSFQSSGLVILHMLHEIRPDLPALFLDTGFHFPETLEFKERIVQLFGLNLIDLRGEHGSREAQEAQHGTDLYRRDPNLCCHINKVAPLQDALAGYDAWISGIRRDQSVWRQSTPIAETQVLASGKPILKVHPLALWSRSDVEDYVREHEIPTHPLYERGYRSIGCWPCTSTTVAKDSEREGRWAGLEKTECGIHTFGRAPDGQAETGR